jgi:hypothetical protein
MARFTVVPQSKRGYMVCDRKSFGLWTATRSEAVNLCRVKNNMHLRAMIDFFMIRFAKNVIALLIMTAVVFLATQILLADPLLSATLTIAYLTIFLIAIVINLTFTEYEDEPV